MKNNWIKVVAAVTAIVCFTGVVQAIPITGNIGISGSADLNSGSVNNATFVVANGWTSNFVGSAASGSFAGLSGAKVTMTTSQWNFVSGTLANFWTVGGFTFNLSSSSIFTQAGGFLNVILAGTVSGNSFDVTAFTGSFSVQNPPANGIVTYTESLSFTPVPVPDSGTTVMMLGGALMGLGLLKRKLSA